MPATLRAVRAALRKVADPERAASLEWFLKTGPGEYGEGDRCLGLRVPQLRAIAKEYRALPFDDLIALLQSTWHEERLLALIIFVYRYGKGTAEERAAIFEAYLANTAHINNWDLVDASAEHIVGPHLDPEDIGLLERLARSDLLWERRIAMLSTFHFIKKGNHTPGLRIAEQLLNDEHDLIHKAVGWMLREIGKRDQPTEEAFLRQHHHRMPRTMLRYAIERFPEPLRQQYLKGTIRAPRARAR
jgi:3-methyladenine DNA glycosylase AlkD